MNTTTPSTNGKIEAHQVPVNARLNSLPTHFGRYMMTFEDTAYNFMGRFCNQYRGGYWEFFELSNGGFYMAPNMGKVKLSVPTNGYDGELSSDAAGITVCLFTLSSLSFGGMGVGMFARHFHWLRDFALDHPEAGEIFRAID